MIIEDFTYEEARLIYDNFDLAYQIKKELNEKTVNSHLVVNELRNTFGEKIIENNCIKRNNLPLFCLSLLKQLNKCSYGKTN